MCRLSLHLVATAAFLFSGIAFAEPASPSPISLRWTAPPGCPDSAAVTARMEELLGGPPSASGRRLDAVGAIEARARGFRLDLEVSAGGAASARVLESGSCVSLADAGALVIALAFDPEAVTAQELKRAAAEAPPEPSALPGGEPIGIPDEHDHAAPVPTAALIRIPIRLPPPPPPPAPPPSRAWSIGGFATFTGDAGTLPSVAPGLTAGLSLGLGAFRIQPTFVAWPSSKVSLAAQPNAGAELSLYAFALDGCRRLLPWEGESAAAAALGCIGIELGELRGRGFGVSAPDSGGAFWAAPRLLFRAELAFSTWAALTLDVGAVAPLDRKRFVLDLSSGRQALHEPSPVAGRAGMGLSFRY